MKDTDIRKTEGQTGKKKGQRDAMNENETINIQKRCSDRKAKTYLLIQSGAFSPISSFIQ